MLIPTFFTLLRIIPAKEANMSWKPVDERVFRERMAEGQLAAEHKAIWDGFCENCREPIGSDPVWTARHSDPDGETVEIFYCADCISVDSTRTR